MNEKELYDLAINNVKKYSMLNEIFAIRDKRVEKDDYSIAVNGYISFDELNRYVKYIDRLVNYQNICTVKELNELQEKANKYDKLLSDWNQLEECINDMKRHYEKLLNEPYNQDESIFVNKSCKRAFIQMIIGWLDVNVLYKMQEIQGSDNNE